MRLISKLRTAAWLLTRHGNPFTRWRQHRAWRAYIAHWNATHDWAPRIRDAMACSDNAHIPRHVDAGTIRDGQLIMHNGLRVWELSYAGAGTRDLLVANKGVHEPQEERVFQEVLKQMPAGATMLELGSFWAFYSAWFYRDVPDARCFCIEPEAENLDMGRRNFALNFGENAPRVDFTRAFLDSKDGSAPDATPIVSVDGFMRYKNISHLNLLHLDTQGYEVPILAGAKETLDARRVDYIFISTHGNDLHLKCLEALRRHDFTIIADVDMLETFSFDGLIVGRRSELPGLAPIELSRRQL